MYSVYLIESFACITVRLFGLPVDFSPQDGVFDVLFDLVLILVFLWCNSKTIHQLHSSDKSVLITFNHSFFLH